MDNRKINMKELMAKYHDNKLSTEEFNLLVHYVNTSSDEQLHGALLEHWNSFQDTTTLSTEKKKMLYKGIKSKIHTPFTIHFRCYWMQIAASLLFILMGSWSLYIFYENRQIKELVAQEVTFNSDEIGHSAITLPDGTNVLLNANSSLSYQQDFGYKNRVVSLSGEGLFKVKRDTTKQFTVKTDFIDITVLGTTFNVTAYEDNDIIEMSLIEGKVRVNSTKEPQKFIYVQPNEKVSYHKQSGELQLETYTSKAAISWSQKELVFHNDPLETVFASLEHKFKVTIKTDTDSLLEDRYTGTFDDKNIEKILNVLRVHYHFTYKKVNDVIYIEKQKYNP